MDNFDYRSFLKNNTLLKEEVKDQLITESVEATEEVQEMEKPSSKVKKSELQSQIKEMILASLTEADEEEDVEADIEVDVEADVAPEADMEPEMGDAPTGLTSDEQEIQDSLKVAYDNAIAIGDEKLADQIGNTITFFTRSHVVN